MIKDEYSPYKIVHHLDKIEELRKGVQPYPLQVQIIPTNICNHDCDFCAYRMDGYNSNEQFDDRESLTFDKIKETLDDMKTMGVGGVQYTGGGEPLVHRNIYDIFKYTLDKNIQLSLVTNGQLMNEKLCELLSESAWVRISVDAGNAKTYSDIRHVAEKSYHKTITNISNLVRMRKNNIIGVGFVVEEHNYKEVYEAAKFFKELGVNNFRISASFTPKGFKYFDGFLEEAKDLARKCELLSDKNFTVFNLFNDRVKDTFEGTQDYDVCPVKDLLTYVGADYNVYTCCTLAYNKRGLIGSIKEQTFKQLWDSVDKQTFFKNHNPSKICKHPCMYKNKNEFINYVVKTDAKHTYFI